MREALYRLCEVSGMEGPIGKSFGWYRDLDTAVRNKSILESRGYRVKVQHRSKGRWENLDVSQSKLDE